MVKRDTTTKLVKVQLLLVRVPLNPVPRNLHLHGMNIPQYQELPSTATNKHKQIA